MSGLIDRFAARVRRATGGPTEDPGLRREDARQERTADPEAEQAAAQHEAERRAKEIARMGRQPQH